jgi:hypothetical protein
LTVKDERFMGKVQKKIWTKVKEYVEECGRKPQRFILRLKGFILILLSFFEEIKEKRHINKIYT